MTDRSGEPASPRAAYGREVLRRLFDALGVELAGELLEATRAHVVVLYDRGILPQAQGGPLIRALRALDGARPVYDPQVEDLYCWMERALVDRLGPEAAGNVQLARSRNDLDAAAYRMVLRRRLLDLADAQTEVADAVLARAYDGRTALIVARTHGAPAQPTTLGHLLAAYLGVLTRDLDRTRAAYRVVNCSPLGACALAGTAFPLDREALAAWTGFDALVENTYDAVASTDYVLDALAAAAVGLAQVSRFLETLRLLVTAAPPAVRLDPGLIQISSMMPQKRNIVFIEHLRARAAHVAGVLAGALAASAASPFEDSDLASTDLQPTAWAALEEAAGAYRVLGLALRTAAVADGVPPADVVASGATASELMDALVRRFGLAQRTAHRVVSALVDRAPDPREWTGELLRTVGREVAGRELAMDTDEVRVALDPARFVAGRAMRGGPAPVALAQDLAAAGAALRAHRGWLAAARARLVDARARLAARCDTLAALA